MAMCGDLGVGLVPYSPLGITMPQKHMPHLAFVNSSAAWHGGITRQCAERRRQEKRGHTQGTSVDGDLERSDIEDVDYDGNHRKRWYYRLYSNRTGQWFWEPRLPTPAELAAPHSLRGVSWEPMILAKEDWPLPALCGPHPQRGDAITIAEGWFDSSL
jgi:hypothetical protein